MTDRRYDTHEITCMLVKAIAAFITDRQPQNGDEPVDLDHCTQLVLQRIPHIEFRDHEHGFCVIRRVAGAVPLFIVSPLGADFFQHLDLSHILQVYIWQELHPPLIQAWTFSPASGHFVTAA